MSDTGRFFVKMNGRTFCVEPIDNSMGKGRRRFGDINPATGVIEGNYGDKYIGSIHQDDSIITEKNGFTNITMCDENTNPIDIIRKLAKNN